MNADALIILSLALALMVGVFAAVWALSVRLQNYAFVDVAWSYGIAILAPFYAMMLAGDPTRKWLGATLGMLWSLRLGTHLLIRVCRHHPQEDIRYESLRKQWPGKMSFLLFFEFQAVLILIFSLPFWIVSSNSSSDISWIEWTGLAISLLAMCGEAISDLQLKRFKEISPQADQVCRMGLWYYSRHPNYFFEWMVWVGFSLFALDSPWGWISLLCPVLMWWFLMKVTGIKISEAHSLKRKGEAYREYQRTTNAFVPWFPKR